MMPKIVVPNVGVVEKHTAPILAGLLGEFALATHINNQFERRVCEVDFRLLRGGDGGVDLCPFGLPIQVKTRTSNYGKHLVRVAHPDGKPAELKADAFVFAEWNRGLVVRLFGWCWKRELDGKSRERGKAGHWNAVLHDEDLAPLCRLIHELRSRS